MKVSVRSIALGAAGAALVAGVLAAPANASSGQVAGAPHRGGVPGVTVHVRGDGTQPPAELGNPKEWGVVKFTTDGSAGSRSARTIVEAGGGKWSFGWYATTDGKYCYSNYYHYTVIHSSTVKIAGGTRKDVEGPDIYTNAHLTAGMAYTCETYYAKY
ncbi:lactococcin 972 family bacteriocin [Streptomyces sp. NPDC058733]|uniref:lactococcin 972 family bacteriocin n=1 Tax=Streptomyces sp. NPDC058733 TaxID=3346614 RepID=UPI0036814457